MSRLIIFLSNLEGIDYRLGQNRKRLKFGNHQKSFEIENPIKSSELFGKRNYESFNKPSNDFENFLKENIEWLNIVNKKKQILRDEFGSLENGKSKEKTKDKELTVNKPRKTISVLGILKNILDRPFKVIITSCSNV